VSASQKTPLGVSLDLVIFGCEGVLINELEWI
jgi:hypothetical protein